MPNVPDRIHAGDHAYHDPQTGRDVARLTRAGLDLDPALPLSVGGVRVNTIAGVGVSIALAASETTDGMDITVTVLDAAGAAVEAVHALDLWMSEDADGIGLTGDTYSGDLTATAGAVLSALTAKKHWRVVTDATGVFAATLVDDANPADQYVAVRAPAGSAVLVSAASGDNWEGA